MPTYELIMLARMNNSAATTGLLKGVADAVLQSGGIVRSITCLGDRILQTNIRDKERIQHNTGRYMSMEIDANPKVLHFAQSIAKNHMETLNVFVSKLSVDKSINRIYSVNAVKLSPYYNMKSEFEENVKKLKQLKEAEDKIVQTRIEPRREQSANEALSRKLKYLRKKEKGISMVISPSEYDFNKN